ASDSPQILHSASINLQNHLQCIGNNDVEKLGRNAFSEQFELNCIAIQEENLMLKRGKNKEYLPIEGLNAFNKATAELLLGADNPAIEQHRVATVQGLSGTGSLLLGAALIERYFPGAKVLISNPTWGNHKNIFNDAGVPWSEYRYYDTKTVGLDFEGMIEDIKVTSRSNI
ncbi:aspartate aminotransferase, partial [Trifolium medium]|nr:aspartate aminotransferase [Trifolium medium]